jgi:hypothetical protein
MALDLVVANDSSQVVCSELVYRGFDEAVTRPDNLLRLKVATRDVQNTPLPGIDLGALLIESLDDYQRSLPKSKSLATATANDSVEESDLDDLLLQARAQLGINGVKRASSGAYVPNPKTIVPADLEFSPSLNRVGRLAMVVDAL